MNALLHNTRLRAQETVVICRENEFYGSKDLKLLVLKLCRAMEIKVKDACLPKEEDFRHDFGSGDFTLEEQVQCDTIVALDSEVRYERYITPGYLSP